MAGVKSELLALINVNKPQDHERHLVLVADRKADYWPRLSAEYQRASQSYSRILFSDPPPNFSVGALPQVVVYADGKPEKVFRGQREVSTLLASITSGTWPANEGGGNAS